tara:strand:- start:807 stop:1397 length:591 start_codon:yes stop_codon:yes gene_type:complete
MELWAIVLFTLFIISFISFFGDKIINKILSMFSKSFLYIPLKHIGFITKNIDNIIIISVFFILGIMYVVIYDIKLNEPLKQKGDYTETHKVTFKENLENLEIKKNIDIVKGMKVENQVDNALDKILDIDIERDLQVTNYENICDEKDLNKLKQKCSLLKSKGVCNKPKCCTWCQSKLKCAAANNNSPIFQEDIDCN